MSYRDFSRNSRYNDGTTWFRADHANHFTLRTLDCGGGHLSFEFQHFSDFFLDQILPVVEAKADPVHIILDKRVHVANYTPRLINLIHEVLEPLNGLEECAREVCLGCTYQC